MPWRNPGAEPVESGLPDDALGDPAADHRFALLGSG